MGEGRAEPKRSGQWEARVPGTTMEPLRGAGLQGTPPHPPSNQEASGRGRNPSDLARRVEWLSRPECTAVIVAIGSVLVVVAFRLRSLAVAPRGGGDRAARVVGPWTSGHGFETHRGGLESGVTARGGEVSDKALVPSSPFPPELRDRIKTPRGPFRVCACPCPCPCPCPGICPCLS